jgi:hypothetical protein
LEGLSGKVFDEKSGVSGDVSGSQVALYSIIDDLLKALGAPEDCRRHIRDAEVITAALVATRYFGGNQAQACQYWQEHRLIPKMGSASRFNRRLHALDELIDNLQQQLGLWWMPLNETVEYLLDSVPIAVCDNIRIARCR